MFNKTKTRREKTHAESQPTVGSPHQISFSHFIAVVEVALERKKVLTGKGKTYYSCACSSIFETQYIIQNIQFINVIEYKTEEESVKAKLTPTSYMQWV